MNNKSQSSDRKDKEDDLSGIEKNITDKKNIKSLKETKKLDSAEVQKESKKNNEDNININLKEEIENLKEEKLRLLAEMENLRKRSERDKVDSIKYGSINFARDILSPSDNLSRALDAIPLDEKMPQSISNLIDGLKMVQKEFMIILLMNGYD